MCTGGEVRGTAGGITWEKSSGTRWQVTVRAQALARQALTALSRVIRAPCGARRIGAGTLVCRADCSALIPRAEWV